MLEHIRIENFRCLKEVDVPLRPLTVLIGPNDSGKSAFLAAIQTVAGSRSFQIPGDAWRQQPAFFEGVFVNAFHANGKGSIRAVQEQSSFRVIQEGRQYPSINSTLFRLPSQGVPMDGPGVSSERGAPELSNDGGQIPSLLDYLLRRDRKRHSEYIESAKRHIPGLEDILIATPTPDRRRIDLKIERGLELEGEKISTGVRAILFYLALAFHPKPPRIILIEEPENGVHPRRLREIIECLRSLTSGAHAEYEAQVIVTTHSPYLLDFVDLEKDQVLVFKRNDDGSRTAEPVDVDRVKLFLDEFKLGEVWYNQKEEGLVRHPK